MFVYVIVCSESLKLYVGQHKKTDLGKYFAQKWYDAHRYSGKRSHIYAALRKHPRKTWSIWPLVSGIETRAELDALEKHFIRVLKTQHPDVGYNICDGGEGFTGPHSEATKRQLVAVRTRYWSDPANHEKRRESSKRMWADPETKKKIREAIKNTPCETRFRPGSSSWNRGTKGVMKPNSGSFQPGHIRTPNSGAKGPNSTSFRLGHKMGVGRQFSEVHRHHLSLAHLGQKSVNKGKKHSSKARQKMRDAWVRRKARKTGK